MKWFYFVDSRGNRHYEKTRKEAEQKRKDVGGGGVIIETSVPPSHPSSAQQSSPPPARQDDFGRRIGVPFENDTSWLRRAGELIYGQNQQIPALQIYHPTRSELHSENDRRILRLKSSDRSAIAHYCAALKRVLPRNETILLCCAPGSTPSSNSGVSEVISAISGGLLIDGSRVLRADRVRKRKSNGARFSDDELAITVVLDAVALPRGARILLIDDVVTSGQTLRVCASILGSAYPSAPISCLAFSSTDYNSGVEGIASRIEVASAEDAMRPLHEPVSRELPGISESAASPAVSATHENQRLAVRAPDSSIQAKGFSAQRERNQKQSQASTSSDCFVVTAIYDGDGGHPNVIRLRRFRDQRIAKLPFGGMAIKFYKGIGPILATAIAGTAVGRQLRKALDFCMDKGGHGK